MISQIGIAILTFAITNIDDLLILSLYFANPAYRTRNIVLGQYLGIIAIILLGFAGLILGTFLPDHWISFFGVIPVVIGVRGLIGLAREDQEDDIIPDTRSRYQYLSVALVTIANGGDNIGVYAPLFANLGRANVYVYVIVFLLLTSVWCWLAYYITSHEKVKAMFASKGKIVLPVFLMLLGLFIARDFIVWLFNLSPEVAM